MKITNDLIDSNKELFVIPDRDDRYILYSPLNRKVGLINGSGVSTISRFLDKEEIGTREQRFIKDLYKSGF